ncbi:hypothetical protein GUITHDRAFT_120937 [Guillardia theta CCMP2712]|uniref:Uncharacterized protein n=1 Tax=Guillardia theta (strain CCMP2712) TaxID=905079 RepID=L1IAK9_GUITC|nr:hypothetical protein GUITHDRAFT_120937 [Guillardia theta CCMP2712]EKX32870.1 hypothetical protein GUITHDRAFT_120937 [Guillardia theta CCMP2712]|eukprot:XP_005819850.1 hypothetical protein GUITHDRAFT_120937 [Guillardia theta CCMP2712]
MMEDVAWVCEVCQEQIEGIIWQCMRGHLFCGDCCTLMLSETGQQKCRACGATMDGYRNRALERLREKAASKESHDSEGVMRRRKAGEEVYAMWSKFIKRVDNKRVQDPPVQCKEDEKGKGQQKLDRRLEWLTWVVFALIGLCGILILTLSFLIVTHALSGLGSSLIPPASSSHRVNVSHPGSLHNIGGVVHNHSSADEAGDEELEDEHELFDNMTAARSENELNWAYIPVPRPLPKCNFREGDVVVIEWTWVIMADSMGFAFQDSLRGVDKFDHHGNHDLEYGVWVCLIPEAIVRQPCVNYLPNGESDLACFKFHEHKREFHFWRWNFGPEKGYTPVSWKEVQDGRPVQCDFKPGQRITITTSEIEHMWRTHHAFNGSLPPSAVEGNKKRWWCIGPHLMAVIRTRISPTKDWLTKEYLEQDTSLNRPCLKWSSDLGSYYDYFAFDLACMRFDEVNKNFYFWDWNSKRTDPGKIVYSVAYRAVRRRGPLVM